MKECECPPNHTITKLGHNRDCPWFGKIALLTDQTLQGIADRYPQVMLFQCGGPTCVDGKPHNFDWATYADDTLETGVCRCGYRELDHYLMVMP